MQMEENTEETRRVPLEVKAYQLCGVSPLVRLRDPVIRAWWKTTLSKPETIVLGLIVISLTCFVMPGLVMYRRALQEAAQNRRTKRPAQVYPAIKAPEELRAGVGATAHLSTEKLPAPHQITETWPTATFHDGVRETGVTNGWEQGAARASTHDSFCGSPQQPEFPDAHFAGPPQTGVSDRPVHFSEGSSFE